MKPLENTQQRLITRLLPEVGRSLGAVQSATQALLNGADQDTAFRRELLRGMEDELRRLQNQLDNLVQFQALNAGLMKLEYRPVIFSEWLMSTLTIWREQALGKGLAWEVDIPTDLPLLAVDPDRFSLVLDNLFRNAIENTPVGGTVSVKVGSESGELWICIGDTGSGIPSDVQERIFEPFQRAEARRRFSKGLGLGLCVARMLVSAHGGQLIVESTPGKGSNFTIQLPLSSYRPH